MKRRKPIAMCLGLVVVLGGLCLVGSRASEAAKAKQNRVFQLAEVHGADYPTSIANEKFARLVEEKTQGRIQIKVYMDSTLGDENQVIEKMRQGEIAFGRISISPLAEYVDQLHVLMLPYLYKNSQHMFRVLDSEVGEAMLESLKEAHLTGLAWYDSGARSFYLKANISGVEQFQNKKIRVQKNSLMYALCEALGANPESLTEEEIYRGVRDGSLDGAENNIPTYETYKQYEVCPYYILDEHTRIPEVLVASSEVLKELSEKDQKLILEAAQEAGLYERTLWNQREAESIARLKERGVHFMTLSEETKSQLKKACESLYQEFGTPYEAIIEQINNMA